MSRMSLVTFAVAMVAVSGVIALIATQPANSSWTPSSATSQPSPSPQGQPPQPQWPSQSATETRKAYTGSRGHYV